MKSPKLVSSFLFGLHALVAAQQSPEFQPLPQGRWWGTVTNKTVPDVDKDGEWQQEMTLVHCNGIATIQFRREDGKLEPEFAVSPIPFQRMFILLHVNAEKPNFEGWVESQVWTLVDARPKGWTLGQSRAVINQDKKPDDPWFTFRRFAWGSIEYDPEGCNKRPSRTK